LHLQEKAIAMAVTPTGSPGTAQLTGITTSGTSRPPPLVQAMNDLSRGDFQQYLPTEEHEEPVFGFQGRPVEILPSPKIFKKSSKASSLKITGWLLQFAIWVSKILLLDYLWRNEKCHIFKIIIIAYSGTSCTRFWNVCNGKYLGYGRYTANENKEPICHQLENI